MIREDEQAVVNQEDDKIEQLDEEPSERSYVQSRPAAEEEQSQQQQIPKNEQSVENVNQVIQNKIKSEDNDSAMVKINLKDSESLQQSKPKITPAKGSDLIEAKNDQQFSDIDNETSKNKIASGVPPTDETSRKMNKGKNEGSHSVLQIENESADIKTGAYCGCSKWIIF